MTTTELPPGAEQHRRRGLRYELVGCALHGHESLAPDDADRTGRAELLYRRDDDDVVWLRCVRCDSWIPYTADRLPAPTGDSDVDLPLRGRPLRDRFVLRLIAVDRVLHFLVLAAVAVAIFLFAHDRARLQGDYTRILNRLQGAVGGPLTESSTHGLLSDLNDLFAISTQRLYLYGIAIAAYAVVNGVEAVGLWRARRWAEYLTLVEVVVLVPVEVYELTGSVSPLKILTLLINLAVVAYLVWTHRLLGVRGGGHADRAERERDTGWEPLERTTPWVPADPR